MSYLVLARKTRPKNFAEVVGQSSVKKTLQNSIVKDRIAHAILFSGVRGVGKTTLARIMAKAINCTDELDKRPCNNCTSCQDINVGNSLDLYEIDGASNRGIQEIRELKEKIRFLPTSSRNKVIIIDEVHMLTTEAFNGLLKTLEEPPAHVYFMFATTEIHKIPITILSRCQQYELGRINANELNDFFTTLAEKENYKIEPAALSLIVKEAGGSVRDGLSLLDQVFSYGDTSISAHDVIDLLGLVNRDILHNITNGLLAGAKADVFHGLEEVMASGMDIRRFLEDLMDCFRTLLLCKIKGCDNLIDLPDEEIAIFKELAKDFSSETIHLKLTLLLTISEDLHRSKQPRLILETGFLKIIESQNVIPTSALLAKLDEIIAADSTQLAHIPSAGSNSTPADQQSVGKDQLKKKQVPIVHGESQEKSQKIDTSTIREKFSHTKENNLFSLTPSPPQTSEVSAPVINSEKPEQEEVEKPGNPREDQLLEPQGAQEKSKEKTQSIPVHPHEKDIRRNWLEFIEYVKDRKVWMAKDLQRADSIKHATEGELHLNYNDPANCALLRNKDNHKLVTEYALDFFQKPLKVCFVLPDKNAECDPNGNTSPQQKRKQLASDPLVTMTAEIFNGEVADIRIGPRSR